MDFFLYTCLFFKESLSHWISQSSWVRHPISRPSGVHGWCDLMQWPSPGPHPLNASETPESPNHHLEILTHWLSSCLLSFPLLLIPHFAGGKHLFSIFSASFHSLAGLSSSRVKWLTNWEGPISHYRVQAGTPESPRSKPSCRSHILLPAYCQEVVVW